MTSKNRQNSVTAGKLKDVMERDQANLRAAMPKPAGAPKLGPTKSGEAELDQDPGAGYNPGHIFPQQ
ncbi:MAG TPA: hypothetical protein VJ323_00490 [Bryobacteraceae bacterium]|jgi:hypothetical protein|nr:hypothetical protein [Bryobacteraceae bacterium]